MKRKSRCRHEDCGCRRLRPGGGYRPGHRVQRGDHPASAPTGEGAAGNHQGGPATGEAGDNEAVCVGLRHKRLCLGVVQLHPGRAGQGANRGRAVEGCPC